jgi:hypothetical protein
MAEHFAGGGLIETRFRFQLQNADRFQQPQGAQGIGIGGVFGRVKRDHDMALSRQIVDFVRLNVLDDADQVGGVCQIAVMQKETQIRGVAVLI